MIDVVVALPSYMLKVSNVNLIPCLKLRLCSLARDCGIIRRELGYSIL